MEMLRSTLSASAIGAAASAETKFMNASLRNARLMNAVFTAAPSWTLALSITYRLEAARLLPQAHESPLSSRCTTSTSVSSMVARNVESVL
jgi:hypothetical protein